ncbi:hypothetical protein CVT24_006524 [Panaeolus cyanescens]|uniref:Major facilitator superfamily (MFS) profile domain-containing protein n=1 Tax=Panaeolus cyanescens TaxID=181874 RepID=A0A409VZV7_9AGAR|nr:hypothetical protein CVT24_006524 [Panaeolus cyanescens]
MSAPSLLPSASLSNSLIFNGIHHEDSPQSACGMSALEPVYLCPSRSGSNTTRLMRTQPSDSNASILASKSSSKDIPMEVLSSKPSGTEKVPNKEGDQLSTMAPASDGSQTPLRLTPKQRRNGWIQFLTLCWCVWLVGWNDGSTGPLLPRIQEYYGVGFAVVSGYVSGAATNIWLNDRIGFGKVLVVAALCQLFSYIIIMTAPPFPLLVCAYFLTGFGLAIQSAQANGFVGTLQENMNFKLGIMHGSYGLGAFTSPFASTFFSGLSSRRWAFHYTLSAGLSIMNVAILIWVFRFKRQDDVQREAGQEPSEEVHPIQDGNSFQQIVGIKAVHLLTVFALIYIGWIVTFIIRERGGGLHSGFISSGFFGGLALGRVALIWLNNLVGVWRIIIIYGVIGIALELTVWFVPSIIGNAVAISLVGLVMGPVFPLLVSHMTRILPKRLLTGCVGLVTGIGMGGSAALPFITGVLASKFGIVSLQPFVIAMMAVMVVVWLFVPRHDRRAD